MRVGVGQLSAPTRPVSYQRFKEPSSPVPLDHSKFRENGSQPPPNRTYTSQCIRLSILEFRNFEIALNLSPVRADSIRLSLQLISRASRTVPLPLSMGLSSVLPQLIPWLIQLLLAAQPITGKRWVLWRLRCHTGVRT